MLEEARRIAAEDEAMCAAMGSPHEVSGAAHVGDRTALRIEGVAPSVEARLKGLRELRMSHAEVTATAARVRQGFERVLDETLAALIARGAAARDQRA